jgi:hypothetical protein
VHQQKVAIVRHNFIFDGITGSNSGFFSGIFLNLELSFETQSSHQSFSAVKMKLFELNFVTCEN